MKTPSGTSPQALILASSSPYRRQLLERLDVTFDCQSPEIDENPRDAELPRDLAQRLARQKAAAIAAASESTAVVIGSDQVASVNGQRLGKAGNRAAAIEQLALCSGQAVDFFTAVCVVHRGREYQHLDQTTVNFRALTATDIERYVALEPAFDCAGSFKCEGLGITLFSRLSSDDPTALIGLPLIALAEMLRKCGIQLP